VARRTTSSIVLLTVLLAGIITPTGVCALMCERHSRVETQLHCSQSSDTMPGMGHDHSAMNHPAFVDTRLVVVSRSCQTRCVTAERLNVSRKVVPQLTVVQAGAVVLEAAAKFVMPAPAAAWSADSGPPAPPTARGAAFSILRI
jgi:hypothetical protein